MSIENGSHRKEIERIRIINSDISLINKALDSNDEVEVRKTHIQIDGKYQSCIKNWGMGMYAFHLEHGFIYDNLDMDSLKDNLMVMRPKLEAFKEQWNVADSNGFDSNVKVVVNNSIDINVSFEQAREVIEKMPGLTEDETQDIIRRINELEEISKEDISKKRKWEKIKPIIVYVLDKGVDVAMPILQLIIQKKFGL